MSCHYISIITGLKMGAKAAAVIVCLIALGAAKIAMSTTLREPMDVPTPPLSALLFEEMGVAYTDCIFAHGLFVVPVSAIIKRAKSLLKTGDFIAGEMVYESKHLNLRIAKLNSTIVSIEIETEDIHRTKRVISVNLNLDVTKAIGEFFHGVETLVNAPKYKYLLRRQLGIIKIVNGTIRTVEFLQRAMVDESEVLEQLITNYTGEMAEQINELNQRLADKRAADEILENVNDGIDMCEAIASAGPYIAERKIPPSLFSPAEAQEYLTLAQHYAYERNKVCLVSKATEVYDLEVDISR